LGERSGYIESSEIGELVSVDDAVRGMVNYDEAKQGRGGE